MDNDTLNEAFEGQLKQSPAETAGSNHTLRHLLPCDQSLSCANPVKQRLFWHHFLSIVQGEHSLLCERLETSVPELASAIGELCQ